MGDDDFNSIDLSGWEFAPHEVEVDLQKALCEQGAKVMLTEIRKGANVWLTFRGDEWFVDVTLDGMMVSQCPLSQMLSDYSDDFDCMSPQSCPKLSVLSEELKKTAANIDKYIAGQAKVVPVAQKASDV